MFGVVQLAQPFLCFLPSFLAMAFKWVLADGMPSVPYLTVMEWYVIATFWNFFLQGISFWLLADGYNYRCGVEEYGGNETETSRDWITGAVKVESTENLENVTCEMVHIADRVVLLVEVLLFFSKNLWFLYRYWKNRNTTRQKSKGFIDLSYLKEFRGEHMKHVGEEEQGLILDRSDWETASNSTVVVPTV